MQTALAVYQPAVINLPENLFKGIEANSLSPLFEEHAQHEKNIHIVADIFSKPSNSSVLSYFLEGNMRDSHYSFGSYIFERKNALKALHATYWSRVMAMTDIQDVMPQARKDEWSKNIAEHKTPEFTPDSVVPTLQGLLASRLKFFAEKVDGIFQSLSRSHVTNSPYAFNKRMIINYVLDSWGFLNSTEVGYIHDLRTVISRFIKGDSKVGGHTYELINSLKDETGKWHELDGGALKIKLFKKGTAHLEVHPDVAWRLNEVLSTLYPSAIPSEARKADRSQKNVSVIRKTLNPEVINFLQKIRFDKKYDCFFEPLPSSDFSKEIIEESREVVRLIGGKYQKPAVFKFDYPGGKVLAYIIRTGCIPDCKTHQFYETPEDLRVEVESRLEAKAGDDCLEPEAGRGALAQLLPIETTDCVEISPLFSAILSAKGFTIHNKDFVRWAKTCKKRYDKIAMNPPYTKGQAKEHLLVASELLKPRGRLVAVLPCTLKHNIEIHGFQQEWSEVFEDRFERTSVRVSILTLTRTL